MEQHIEKQQHQSEAGANGTRLPRLRSSCDSCTRSKLRCDQAKPACRRCSDRNEVCVYSRIGRVGRPPRLSTDPLSTLTTPDSVNSPSQAQHRAKLRTHKASRRASIRDSGGETISESRSSQTDPPRDMEHIRSGDRRPRTTVVTPVDPRLREDDDNNHSIFAASPIDPWLLASGCGEESLSPSRLQQLLTPTSEASTSALNTTAAVARSVSNNAAYLASTGHYMDLDFNYLAMNARTLPSASPDALRFRDYDNFIMSPKSSAAQPYFPQPPPKPFVLEPEPGMKAVGQLETVWNQITSTVSDLQQVIGTIAPDASLSAEKRCACPILIGRLQLLAAHPCLAPQRCTGSYRGDRLPPRTLPLDLLIFLEDIVYRTVAAVTDCAVCRSSSRALLTLYLHVDWLVDMLKETLESGLPGLAPSNSRFEFTPFTFSGSSSAREGRPRGIPRSGTGAGSGAGSESGTGSYGSGDATGEEQEPQAGTRALHLGSFCLEGELWQICIRELLKTRLNRLSRVLETSAGNGEDCKSRCGESDHAGYSTRSSLESALRSMAADTYSKIEFLFGMMELWEA